MRLREFIEVDHRVLGIYLGDDLFDLVAAEYVKQCPSSKTSLRHFADQLPGFLARTEPFSAHGQIPELARFERLLMTAFDAAEANKLPNEALAVLPMLDGQIPNCAFTQVCKYSAPNGMLWRFGKRSAKSENHQHPLKAQTIG